MEAYQKAYRSLNQAQKKAVDCIDGPVLIVAGPGTGKTQLLTTRVAHILANTDTSAENILCLTFTETATQTMRERLIQLIGKDGYAVTISTYHSFGADIIRKYPEYFTDFSNRQPVDELGADSIIRSIITELEYDHPLKFADSYVKDIISFISDAKTALLSPADITRILQSNNKFIEQASKISIEILSSIVRIDKKALPLFEKLLFELRKIKLSIKFEPGIVNLQQLAVETLQKALEDAKELNRSTPLTDWKNQWLSKNENAEFVFSGLAAQRRLIAAAGIYQQYLDHLETNQLFDYDDMILQAVKLLSSSKEFRYSLQEQYLYILLDEFQDTNTAQLRLVELLTDSPVHERHPNICAVGDDDQAIYAFQGAHYSHMLKFITLYRDVVVIGLEDSYRSTSDIINFSQKIVSQISERLHDQLDIKKVLRAAHKPSLSGVVERSEANSDIEQYAWIAQKISELVKGGHQLKEIAVLAPQHRYLEALVGFLHDKNLPVYYERRENVLDDPLIAQIIRQAEFIQALAEKHDDYVNALCPEVFSYNFWHIPTSIIWNLSWQARDTGKSWLEIMIDDSQLRPIALFFLRLSSLAKTERLEVIIDYLIGVLPCPLQETNEPDFTSTFYQYYFSEDARKHKLGEFWQLLTNLTVLRARLRDYQYNEPEPLSLNDFLLFVTRHRAANIKIINTSPYYEAREALQLMTAYKAKGAEFQTVFVIDCNDEVWGSKTRTAVSRLSLPKNLAYIRYNGANDDEHLRLFYVAITRAKQNIFLVNYRQNYNGKAMTRLKYLDETIDDQGELRSPLLPVKQRLVSNTTIKQPISAVELSTYWYQRHESGIKQPNLLTLLQKRLERFQLNPTNLTNFTDIVHAGPSYFLMNSLLAFPHASSVSSQYGNAIHDMLLWLHNYNQINKKLPTVEKTLQHYNRILTLKRLNADETAKLLKRGEKCLSLYLAQRTFTIKSTNYCEYSFKNEAVLINNAHLSGTIDKLMVNNTDKTITIVDYKTGHHYARWQRTISLHRYRQQLYFYKLLVENSRRFSGYKVVDAYLEFVEPDEGGIIHELHVTYDDNELYRIKNLIEAVWHDVMTMHLPDIATYTTDINGIENFESDLIAGQK
ncbi:MAG TPA: ATP-dependent helicase [Candidatus Saccharimonadales bacterium]|nr:ATP-dependent helicase [Candidatus Saccharimonadales bacterium]